MRVLVCGSKSYKDIDSICHTLNAAYLSWQVSRNEWRSHSDDMPGRYWDEFVLIEGGAPGAAEIAARWWAPQLERDDRVKRLHIQVPADWSAPCDPAFCGKRHRRPREHRPGSYCPAAGARRNQKMLDEYHPDIVFAFTDGPPGDSKDTKDMCDHRRWGAGLGYLDGPARDRLQRSLRHRAGVEGLMRPKQGPGAAGARPFSCHYTALCIFPSGGAVARGFWGSKFSPGGSLFAHPCPYLPRAPRKFFPYASYFLSPGSPYINFPPKFSLFTPHFSYIYKKFSPGGALFASPTPPYMRPADRAPLSWPSGRS